MTCCHKPTRLRLKGYGEDILDSLMILGSPDRDARDGGGTASGAKDPRRSRLFEVLYLDWADQDGISGL